MANENASGERYRMKECPGSRLASRICHRAGRVKRTPSRRTETPLQPTPPAVVSSSGGKGRSMSGFVVTSMGAAPPPEGSKTVVAVAPEPPHAQRAKVNARARRATRWVVPGLRPAGQHPRGRLGLDIAALHDDGIAAILQREGAPARQLGLRRELKVVLVVAVGTEHRQVRTVHTPRSRTPLKEGIVEILSGLVGRGQDRDPQRDRLRGPRAGDEHEDG